MHIEPFHLERWLNTPRTYDLAGAGITKLTIADLIDRIDPELVLNYGITKGSTELRELVAELYPDIGPENVLITNGTAEANLLALWRLLEPGDEFVAITPTYQQCLGIAGSFGATVHCCDVIEEEGYRFDIERLTSLITDKTKIVFCVNPNNPTGTVLSADDMSLICKAAERVGAWVLCDGALRGLETTEQWSATPLPYYNRSIATGSLSKVGITGIRIGWLIAEEKFVEECWVYKDYSTLCHTGIGEYLASFALQPDNFKRYLSRARSIIRSHLDLLSQWVEKNNELVGWVPPVAGHTTFLSYTPEISSIDFGKGLLEQEDVLVSPGDFFTVPKHLRVRYSCEEDELKEGLRRIERYLHSL